MTCRRASRSLLPALFFTLACSHAPAQEKLAPLCSRGDPPCVREALRSDAARRLDTWRDFLARPLLERIESASQASPRWVADVKAAVADLPAEVNLLLADRLAAIVLVDAPGTASFTGRVEDESGRAVAAFVVIDADALAARSANDWATWRESLPFAPESEWRVQARIERPAQDNRRSALQAILLRELGRAIAVTQDAAPFLDLSWAPDRRESPYDGVFPLRRGLRATPTLRASQMPQVYAQLAQTNFPTLAAATDPAEDFAESFANYVHVVLMHRPWEITIEGPGRPAAVVRACWDEPRCADKRRAMEQMLRR